MPIDYDNNCINHTVCSIPDHAHLKRDLGFNFLFFYITKIKNFPTSMYEDVVLESE